MTKAYLKKKFSCKDKSSCNERFILNSFKRAGGVISSMLKMFHYSIPKSMSNTLLPHVMFPPILYTHATSLCVVESTCEVRPSILPQIQD